MINLTKSTFYNEEYVKQKLCDFILRTKMLSMGSECQKFEERFSIEQNRKYSVFVNSGSAANLILIQALLNLGKLKHGDHIGISALTWSTNVMPIIQLGLIPIPFDCEISTLNVSSRTIDHQLENLQALFLTNVLGLCDDIHVIANQCAERGIPLLEDNCESLGSKAHGKLLGNFGLASTFSFFVGHHFSTIEGGMICTDDEELYNMLIVCRAHGWDRNLPSIKQTQLREEHGTDPFFARFTFYDLGYNVRPTEINGFLGNLQIDFLSEMIKRRQTNFNRFLAAIMKNDKIFPLTTKHMEINSNFNMPLIFRNENAFMRYRERFEKAEVEIRPVIAGNITRHPFWKKHVGHSGNYPNTQIIHDRGFYFPNNPELNEQEVEKLESLIAPF